MCIIGDCADPIAEKTAQELGFELYIMKKYQDRKDFKVVFKRWMMERTFDNFHYR